MTKKQIRKATPAGVREVLPNGDIRNPTPEDHLKILEGEYARVKKALLAKREELGLQAEHAAKEERAAFIDAFAPGDDLDDERVVRAAGLLLELGFEHPDVSSDDDKANLARGIGAVLSIAADDIARDRHRIAKVANELTRKAKELECVDLDFLAAELRER